MFVVSFTMREVVRFWNRSAARSAQRSTKTSPKNPAAVCQRELATAVHRVAAARGEHDDDDDYPVAFFAVCDGHGGDQVAKLAATSLERVLKEQLHIHCSATNGSSPSSSSAASPDDIRFSELLVQMCSAATPGCMGPDGGEGILFNERVDVDGSVLRQDDDVRLDDDDDDGDAETERDNMPSSSSSPITSRDRQLMLIVIETLFRSAIQEALLALDSEIRSSPEGRRGDYNCVGCTCCLVGVSSDFILCANCGDSGAAVFTDTTLTMLSVPHRLSDEKERARVRNAGYRISDDERIEGLLAVPRALGDYDFKQCGGKPAREQAVTALADVALFEIPAPSSFQLSGSLFPSLPAEISASASWGVVVGCDGVWDTATRLQVQQAMSPALTSSRRHPTAVKDPNGGGVADSPSTGVCGGGPFRRTTHDVVGHVFPSVTAHRQAALIEGVLLSEQLQVSACSSGPSASGALAPMGLDVSLLTCCGRVFRECVAPTCNDEGVGLDNVSCVVIKCTPLLLSSSDE
jgi:serine/threonine protein phosphatase PrpC